jgi:DNA-binding response OmpR family regulator
VILDILLPDGDGIELLKDIRAKPSTAGTAVMLLSTEAEVRDRVRGLKTGADEYVGKPYDVGYIIARARELAQRDSVATAQESILIIDDSITFRETLKTALADESYRVLTAGSGETGLRMAANLRPTALIVDGELPGIDGATVIRHIRLDAALRGLPCLLLTGSEERDAEMRALDAGADAFVRKDEDIAVILARVSAMMRSAAGRVLKQPTASLQGPKKILAVDDSETYLQQVAEALRADGYEMVLARSGEEALELLAVQPVDCILLDLMMPGMGGRETCKRIKSAQVMRDIPVVMLTAVEDREAMIAGLSAGADDYIAKSSDLELLRARVLAQIRRKQFQDENRLIREHLLRREKEEAERHSQVLEVRAAELKRSNEDLQQFANIAAHDLQEPLRTISSFTQLLAQRYKGKLGADGDEFIAYAVDGAERMQLLIQGVLAYCRVGTTDKDFQEISSEKALLQALTNLRGAIGASDGEVTHDPLPAVTADNVQLSQLFQNLVGNAIKYCNVKPPRVHVSARENGSEWVFSVRDNGIGIEPRYYEKIFLMFQRLHGRTEFSGTGIGLTVCKKIVERHNGRIWVESEAGKGSTFYFALPLRS